MEKDIRDNLIADSDAEQVTGGIKTVQTAMKCPKCGSPVTAVKTSGLILYRCMNCGNRISGTHR